MSPTGMDDEEGRYSLSPPIGHWSGDRDHPGREAAGAALKPGTVSVPPARRASATSPRRSPWRWRRIARAVTGAIRSTPRRRRRFLTERFLADPTRYGFLVARHRARAVGMLTCHAQNLYYSDATVVSCLSFYVPGVGTTHAARGSGGAGGCSMRGRRWALNRRAVEWQMHVDERHPHRAHRPDASPGGVSAKRGGTTRWGSRRRRVDEQEADARACVVRWRDGCARAWRRSGRCRRGPGSSAVGALFTGVGWQWWAVALLGYFFYACVGHSVGYHRYFAHRSFAAPRWAQVLFTVAGTLGCVGSPVGWAQMHRRHHLYSDREGDPYTAHRYRYPTPGALLMGQVRDRVGKCTGAAADVAGGTRCRGS